MTQSQGKKPEHRVLIIDDEAVIGRAIKRILAKMEILSDYAESGEAGLERLENTETQFSLIICDQRMPGMAGTQFLAKAKEMSPETIRFLVTGYSRMDTIIAAVNKGAVQHYIAKPWKHDEMVRAIRSGIAQYERHLENQQLFALAKRQNAKLYDLNCELMETTKHHESELEKLEDQINGITGQLNEKTAKPSETPSQVMNRIISFIRAGDADQHESLNALYKKTVTSLYGEFTDLALRNGFEMPEPDTGGSHE
ncbi:MAG: response regulator, partial [Desulfobacterales bacterium]|nr:response regulator [Desulfobacterales bacterium]